MLKPTKKYLLLVDALQVLVETDKSRGGRLHSFHKHNNCGIEWMSRVNIGHDSDIKVCMNFTINLFQMQLNITALTNNIYQVDSLVQFLFPQNLHIFFEQITVFKISVW